MIKILGKEIKIFEEGLRARGITPGHIQSIRFQIEVFLDYLEKEKVKRLTGEILSGYRNHLFREARTKQGRPLGVRLLARRLSAVKRFLSVLTQRGRFLLNPARALELPRVERGLPRFVPSHAAVRRMIEGIGGELAEDLRDRAVLELLYSTGLRVRELLSLGLYDVDFEGSRVLVRQGKGGKDRVVPLGRKAGEALEEYLCKGRPFLLKGVPVTRLFLTLRGGKALSYPALRGLLKRRSPDPRVTPHTLRHACAIGMLRGGADIRFIQELLGHERLETTQIYTRILPVELKSVHRRFHPREKGNLWRSASPFP